MVKYNCRLDEFGILPFGASAWHLIFWGKFWVELDPVNKFSAPGFPVWQNGFGPVTPFLLILLIRNRRVWHFGPCAAPLALISCHTFRRALLQACGRLGKRLRGIPPPTNAHHAGVEQVLEVLLILTSTSTPATDGEGARSSASYVCSRTPSPRRLCLTTTSPRTGRARAGAGPPRPW